MQRALEPLANRRRGADRPCLVQAIFGATPHVFVVLITHSAVSERASGSSVIDPMNVEHSVTGVHAILIRLTGGIVVLKVGVGVQIVKPIDSGLGDRLEGRSIEAGEKLCKIGGDARGRPG
jgi:hypothetical protein